MSVLRLTEYPPMSRAQQPDPMFQDAEPALTEFHCPCGELGDVHYEGRRICAGCLVELLRVAAVKLRYIESTIMALGKTGGVTDTGYAMLRGALDDCAKMDAPKPETKTPFQEISLAELGERQVAARVAGTFGRIA